MVLPPKGLLSPPKPPNICSRSPLRPPLCKSGCPRPAARHPTGVERTGRNQGAYHGERIDVDATLLDCAAAAASHGWLLDTLAPRSLARWAARRPAGSDAPAVYLSAGIHGDEPAGVLAMLRLFRENVWPRANLYVVPCLNPEGMRHNTRENADGVDVNRDYRRLASPEAAGHVAWLQDQPGFDLSLLLHEDWEAHGFYCYELQRDAGPSAADAMVAAVAQVCPIDRSEQIDGRPLDRPGVIRPLVGVSIADRPDWPEAIWLSANKTQTNYTLEAPSDWPLDVRVRALVTAVRAALHARFGPFA